MKPLDPRLGRVFRDDRRNAEFPIRTAIAPTADIQNRDWVLSRNRFLDQLWTPECTGFSTAHDLAAAPMSIGKVTAELAHSIYIQARKDDEFAGEDYDGSSVLGSTRALKPLGFEGEYRWAGENGYDAADDVALALSHLGGVVIGTDFLEDMFELQDGVFNVSGRLAGGHAYFARWIAVSKMSKRVRLPIGAWIKDEPLIGGPNTWGLNWGRRGEWAMWLSDLRRLLEGIEWPGDARVATIPFRRAHA